jgi:hypothetical protein
MGKPVMCYLREDAVDVDMPVINVNPDTIWSLTVS